MVGEVVVVVVKRGKITRLQILQLQVHKVVRGAILRVKRKRPQ